MGAYNNDTSTTTRLTRVAWKWVFLTFGIGFVVTGLAFIAPGWIAPNLPGWLSSFSSESAWGSTFVSIGAAVFVATVFFLIEPLFTKHASDEAARTARETVDAEIADERAERAAMSARIDDLARQVADFRGQRAARQDDAIDALHNPSFQTVVDALATANEFRAIHAGGITVPAGDPATAERVRFTWAERKELPQTLLRIDLDQSGSHSWSPEETTAEVGASLWAKIEYAGNAHNPRSIGRQRWLTSKKLWPLQCPRGAATPGRLRSARSSK